MAGIIIPRVFLALGGGEPMPCKSGKVTKTSKRSAGVFSADLSITRTTQYGMDLAAWADFQPVDAQILMSTAPGQADVTSMILGEIDMPKIDWATMSVSISGRDKTKNLIENRRSQKFQNQSSADIVSSIAQSYGLNPQVTPNSSGAFAGKQYNDSDTAHLAIHRTDFEIISDLADREGCRWYVDGPNLIFEPKGQASDTYPIFWAPPGVVAPYGVATVEDFKAWRNMTAAKPHTVNVKSWHDKKMQQFNGSASAAGVGTPVNIDHHHNRKTQDQVDALAASRAMDAIRHDCNISFRAPLDLTVSPQMQAQLTGTGTIYDQAYDMDQIDWSVSFESGGYIDVKAKAAKAGRTVSQGSGSDGADAAPGDSGDS